MVENNYMNKRIVKKYTSAYPVVQAECGDILTKSTSYAQYITKTRTE